MRLRAAGLLLIAVLAGATCGDPAASVSVSAAASTGPTLTVATASPSALIPTPAIGLASPSLRALTPDITPQGTPGTTTAGTAPDLPPSVGNAVLFHLQLATDIASDGTPINQGTSFPSGTKAVFGLLAWSTIEPGTELKARLYQGDRFVWEGAHVVEAGEAARQDDSMGYVFGMTAADAFPDGAYSVEVDYNGLPDEVVGFSIGRDVSFDQVLGSGSASGPIPYADPTRVLVVTRFDALRARLGAGTDAVLAAAARVGDLHDLDADGTQRAGPEAAAEEVHRLLRAGSYRYLLIVGNDDVVPFFRLANPVADSEAAALSDWDLPAQWLPSDDPYTDLDGDPYGVPDLATARIPSSDDAALLLTQLGDVVPPDGGAYALVNQERKSQAGVVIGAIDAKVQVRLEYAPPTTADGFATDPNAASARYLYVLLHGIGVETNAWSTNTVAWEPTDVQDPLAAEWIVHEADQAPAITVEANPGSHGVVQIGACYGAWTLDTKQAPQHKTADNDLALHYLKGGVRAFIADTHLSYSTLMGPDDTPRGRTGFELVFWRGIGDGLTPIDAFFAAKVAMGDAIDALVKAGRVDSAKITLKTLHYMAYFGRP